MENKILYFLRHGESVYNQQGLVQGDLDTPLSHEGRKETKEVAPALLKFGFKNIVYSPLARAKETTEIINEILKLPTYVKEDLEEMDFGKWDGEMKLDSWANFRRDFYEFGSPPPGGESKHDLFKRSEKAVKEICNEIDEDPILIVSHGMLMRVLIGEWFTNSTEKELRAIEMPNLCLYKVEVDYDHEKILPKKYKFIRILVEKMSEEDSW